MVSYRCEVIGGNTPTQGAHLNTHILDPYIKRQCVSEFITSSSQQTIKQESRARHRKFVDEGNSGKNPTWFRSNFSSVFGIFSCLVFESRKRDAIRGIGEDWKERSCRRIYFLKRTRYVHCHFLLSL